jgi:transcriptional regulator with XRE-family HTH domain
MRTEIYFKLPGEENHDIPLERLGDVLPQIRRHLGIPQIELAKRIGIPIPSLSRWERQQFRGVTLDNLFQVIKGMGLTVSCQIMLAALEDGTAPATTEEPTPLPPGAAR